MRGRRTTCSTFASLAPTISTKAVSTTLKKKGGSFSIFLPGLGVPIDPRIGRLQECAAEIFNSYSTEISIRRRVGRWDVRETVTLSSPSTARPTPTLKLSDLSAKFSSVLTCLSNGSVNLVSKALEIDDGGSGLFGMFSREQQLRLVHEAVQAQNGPVFALLVSCCEMVTKASDSVMDAPLVLEVAQDTIRQVLCLLQITQFSNSENNRATETD